MAIQAHLVGKTYGVRPTDVLDSRPSDFWMDAEIRAAGTKYLNEQRQQAQASGTATGSASDGEKEDLVADNEDRADRRDQSGGQPASIHDQMAGLDAMDQSDGEGPI